MSGEIEARAWIASRPWLTPDMIPRLEYLVERTREEAARQNLVAPSTLDHVWERHVQDSVQLVDIVGRLDGRWLDIGSGGGFPGLVLGALGIDICCVEPRRIRAAYLADVACDWSNVQIVCAPVERMTSLSFDVITARAVAPAATVFALAQHVATADTTWLLPSGRSASTRVTDAEQDWSGVFHVEQSVTSAAAGIIVASGVARRQI